MSVFKYVKGHVAILDVISAYTTLKQAGHYWKGCCPFHSEKTASFTVTPNKEIYYCFGCNQGGDVISFVATIEHCSPLEAVQHLIDRFSLTVPEEFLSKESHTPAQETSTKKQYWQICQLVASWCHQQLLSSRTVVQYLQKRNIEKAIFSTFLVGYFPSGQKALKELLAFVKTHHYLLDDLVEANILSVTKGTIFSPLEDRIIFPIKDHLGRYCGFGGRIFKDTDTRPKYYNSKENPYFTKGTLLFGFDIAKKNIQQANCTMLVEGYMDCLAMVQHGFTNTIATLGTACNLEHLKTIARHCSCVYVLYDGDGAGQKAMLRLTELCWQVNLELKVVQLPPTEDPASLLAKGGAIKDLVEKAQDIFLFFITNLGINFHAKTLAEKLQNTKQLLSIIAKLEEPLKQDFLLQTASKAFAIPFDSLKKELLRISHKEGSASPQSAREHSESPPLQPIDLKKISDLEKKLFSVIINNIEILTEDRAQEIIDSFKSPLKELLTAYHAQKKENPALDFADFFAMLTLQDKDLMSKILVRYQTYDGAESFEQLFNQCKKEEWKAQVHLLTLHIAKAQKEGDEESVKRLLHDFQILKQKLTRGTL